MKSTNSSCRTRAFPSRSKSRLRNLALISALALSPSLYSLDPNQPSRAAIVAAAARAVASHDPDPFTRNPDWLAAPFLSLSELALIFSHPINRAVDQDPRISMLYPDNLALIKLADVRTRFIDDRLQLAAQDGFSEIVIIGAGLDTRPYRFRQLLEKTKVFEVDTPGTQAMKKRRVLAIFGALPPNVTYTGDLPRLTGKTFFIWEGGAMHQTEARAREILRTVAQAPSGSRLVMDFVGKDALDRARRDPASPQERFDAAWGEPWLFGVPEQPGPAAFFQELGFEIVELLPADSPTAARRYLTHRDQTVVGQGIETDDRVPVTLAELRVK